MFQFPVTPTSYPPLQTDQPLVPVAGPHTQQLWEAALPLFRDIMATPFITQLGDGTLAAPEYRYYLQQDNHYLETYINGLRSLGRNAPDASTAAFWNDAAALSEGEVDSHNSELEGGSVAEEVAEEQGYPSPSNLAYQAFLRDACATQPYAIGASAMLPCFWTYPEVALRLLPAYRAWVADHPGEQHPYEEWIMLYSGDGFVEPCAQAIELVEEALSQATPEDAAVAVGEFCIGTLHEVMFFDQSRRHFS